MGRSPDFRIQFEADDQAADILDNVGTRVAFNLRYNFVQLPEEELELLGCPPEPPSGIDNMDALTSTGSLGGLPDVNPQDGLLDDGRLVFFSVDAASPGWNPGTVYVQFPGSAPFATYADFSQLGLQAGDSIDAICVWDFNLNGIFDVGDGVVFSLGAGSASLPYIFAGGQDTIAIHEGGIFLAVPNEGIVAALPDSFFSLQVGDELDAIHCVDPRYDIPPCLSGEYIPVHAADYGALIAMPAYTELDRGDSTNIWVTLDDSERDPDHGGISGYNVIARVDDPTMARIVSAEVTYCGLGGWHEGCCACSHDSICGYCPDDSSYFLARRLSPPVTGANLCLGAFTLKSPFGPTALNPPTAPGLIGTRMRIVASITWEDYTVESDTTEALIAVRVPEEQLVQMDIRPQRCPNPLSTRSRVALPLAIVGKDDFKVSTVDPTTVALEGIAPLSAYFDDVSSPVGIGGDPCSCTTAGPDGFTDMVLEFDTQAVVAALGEVTNREVRTLTLTGTTYDGMSLWAQDCVLIIHLLPSGFEPFVRLLDGPAISLGLAERTPVSMVVYDIKGQKVKTVVKGVMGTGIHTIEWKGENDAGQKVAAGVYFCRVQAGSLEKTVKMVLME